MSPQERESFMCYLYEIQDCVQALLKAAHNNEENSDESASDLRIIKTDVTALQDLVNR